VVQSSSEIIVLQLPGLGGNSMVFPLDESVVFIFAPMTPEMNSRRGRKNVAMDSTGFECETCRLQIEGNGKRR
jgi:hypothetical protein